MSLAGISRLHWLPLTGQILWAPPTMRVDDSRLVRRRGTFELLHMRGLAPPAQADILSPGATLVTRLLVAIYAKLTQRLTIDDELVATFRPGCEALPVGKGGPIL